MVSSLLVPGLRVLGFASDPGYRGGLRAGLILPLQRRRIGSNQMPCERASSGKLILDPNHLLVDDVGVAKRVLYTFLNLIHNKAATRHEKIP